MTVRELLARIDSRELAEWMAYESIAGPLGSRRADIQSGIVAATVANANRGKGKSPMPPDKFIPKWDQGRKQTPEEIYARVSAMNARLGGRIANGGA